MKKIIAIITALYLFTGCSDKKFKGKTDFIIANGQMPSLVLDNNNTIHLVYGRGDSLLYSYSSDNAVTFSTPSLISVLPGVYSFAMRGPQIAYTGNGILVTACTASGDIYPFYKYSGSNWENGRKVNDIDTVAKEGLMALSADREISVAAWLDLRGNKRNKIYGAKSLDGGKTWSKNFMIYTSPDTSVCECCKPSLIVKGKNVYVMFRNWLQGNRDMYVTQSGDGASTFGPAQKLGKGNWKLNGCPMDGGNMAIDKKGQIKTVWRREGKIYAAMPGTPEKEMGAGRSCTIEIVNNENVYAWTENGAIVLLKPNGHKQTLGSGSQPILKAVDYDHVVCIWENEKKIHAAVVQL